MLAQAQALMAKMTEELNGDQLSSSRVKGLPSSIDPNKPPRNYRDPTAREDRQQWAAASMEEHRGMAPSKLLDLSQVQTSWTHKSGLQSDKQRV